MCNSCSCGTNANTTTDVAIDESAATGLTVNTYTVAGMTCGHCVSSVSSEVGRIGGVTSVNVDLASGAVQVTSATPLDRETVRAAVEEAGYALARN
ncbi:hypothetical protein GCM10009789_39300 [Kribbella sancticallisti]|uniref:HMA domain-containing protein n=1 Tax=Kribbella sancticallisti TaxID=460087 RepID=A0ABN2DS05_9ACTN